MKNEHPAFFPPNVTILNSLNYEGIAVIELQFHTTFPDTVTDCVLALSQTK